jgi:hypothetical protein
MKAEITSATETAHMATEANAMMHFEAEPKMRMKYVSAFVGRGLCSVDGGKKNSSGS